MHHAPTVPFARANGTDRPSVEVSARLGRSPTFGLFREQDPAFGENLLALQKLFDNRIEKPDTEGMRPGSAFRVPASERSRFSARGPKA